MLLKKAFSNITSEKRFKYYFPRAFTSIRIYRLKSKYISSIVFRPKLDRMQSK